MVNMWGEALMPPVQPGRLTRYIRYLRNNHAWVIYPVASLAFLAASISGVVGLEQLDDVTSIVLIVASWIWTCLPFCFCFQIISNVSMSQRNEQKNKLFCPHPKRISECSLLIAQNATQLACLAEKFRFTEHKLCLTDRVMSGGLGLMSQPQVIGSREGTADLEAPRP